MFVYLELFTLSFLTKYCRKYLCSNFICINVAKVSLSMLLRDSFFAFLTFDISRMYLI